MTQLKDHLSAVKMFSATQEEPAWMLALREDALSKVDEMRLPRIDQVKYFDWPLLAVAEETMDAAELPDAVGVIGFDEMQDHPLLVQYGSITVAQQLPQSLIDQGVIFTDLFTAMKEHSELVQAYFMTKAVKPEEDKLTAAHLAFLNSGAFLYIPKNVVLEEPVEALFYQNGMSHFFHHVLIVAEENSQFSYLERFLSDESNTTPVSANIVVEVIAKSGAQVKFSAVDRLGKNLTTYLNRRGYLMRDAMVDWAIGVMNEGNVVADFDTDLVGDGAHSEIKVVAISGGEQVQAIDTRVTNSGKSSIGHILQHGVIRGHGTLVFNGIGHIIKGAKGADAQQESRILMLSDGARGDANPILLIDENEVTAGHAASVGRVDPDEMYYLMSRGLHKEEAERLVIRGFLGSVLTAIPMKEAQKELIDVIEGKLDA
ncbi:MAG TPA: Fe-S cluster assembly protein SufD [Candidatus Enterococcus stercoravium]|nr:Fe-S cluster assembly protein SufD [Candidatus Enterococcus stercoravium]